MMESLPFLLSLAVSWYLHEMRFSSVSDLRLDRIVWVNILMNGHGPLDDTNLRGFAILLSWIWMGRFKIDEILIAIEMVLVHAINRTGWTNPCSINAVK